MFNGIQGGFGAGLDVDLLKDVAQVDLNCIDADEERRGNLLVAHSLGNQFEGLYFAFTQIVIFFHG